MNLLERVFNHHRRVRGKINRFHFTLCERSSGYRSWHENPHHQKIHYMVLGVYLLGISIGIYFNVNYN